MNKYYEVKKVNLYQGFNSITYKEFSKIIDINPDGITMGGYDILFECYEKYKSTIDIKLYNIFINDYATIQHLDIYNNLTYFKTITKNDLIFNGDRYSLTQTLYLPNSCNAPIDIERITRNEYIFISEFKTPRELRSEKLKRILNAKQ